MLQFALRLVAVVIVLTTLIAEEEVVVKGQLTRVQVVEVLFAMLVTNNKRRLRVEKSSLNHTRTNLKLRGASHNPSDTVNYRNIRISFTIKMMIPVANITIGCQTLQNWRTFQNRERLRFGLDSGAFLFLISGMSLKW